MNGLPYTASSTDYDRQAGELLDAFRSGDEEARLIFKWEHPRYRCKPLAEVSGAGHDRDDARLVIAH